MLRRTPVLGWSFTALLCGAALVHAQSIPDLGFTTRANAALAAQYARKFGNAVTERFARWARFSGEHKSAGYSQRLDSARGREADILQIVNEAINRQVRGIEDRDHWGAEDYWATPAETIGSAGGDCEDFSIAKYYLLKELGVPLGRLHITYVRVMPRGTAHMVLAYYATPEAEPLILDNLNGRVSPASDRFDLEPVYHFNDEELQLVKTGQRGRPAQIRAWLAMQERLVNETRIQSPPGA